MSAAQSKLSDPKYGYDFVVATTQASINVMMKEFLSEVAQPVVSMCYVAASNSEPMAIAYKDLVKQAKGSDPFTIGPDADPAMDPNLRNLLTARFMMGFQVEMGVPPGLADVPDIVTLSTDTGAVEFRLLCANFTVVSLDPGGGYAAKPSWLSVTQPPNKPWIFTSKVDLRLSQVGQDKYSSLPQAVQQQIKNLGADAFSVQQLLFDLENAALETIPTISGVNPGTKLYSALEQSFCGAYFAQMQSSGQPMLGCAVKQSQSSESSLVLTDMDLEVCPFLDQNQQAISKPTAQQKELATLNYLCATAGHTLPASNRFVWNWIEPADEAVADGVVAVNREAFAKYLKSQLELDAAACCYLPYVHLDLDGIKTVYEFSLSNSGQGPMVTYPSPSALGGSSRTPILSFSYNPQPSSDRAGLGGDMGSMTLRSTYTMNVYAFGNTLKVNQHLLVHIDVSNGAQSGSANVIDKAIEDTLTVGVDMHGQLQSSSQPHVTDNSQDLKRDNNWVDDLIGFSDLEGKIQTYVTSMVASSIKDIGLSMIQDFFFPGGKTFSFKSVAFSASGDLTSQITYVDPA